MVLISKFSHADGHLLIRILDQESQSDASWFQFHLFNFIKILNGTEYRSQKLECNYTIFPGASH